MAAGGRRCCRLQEALFYSFYAGQCKVCCRPFGVERDVPGRCFMGKGLVLRFVNLVMFDGAFWNFPIGSLAIKKKH